MATPNPIRRAGVLVATLLLAGAIPAGAQLGGTTSTDISLKDLKFAPNKVTVKPKSTVNFVWKERVAHNIIFDSKRKSGTLNKGTWSTTFDKPGTYKYKCTLHPGMNGQITVK